MITREEIIEIYEDRQKQLDIWLDDKPKKKSISNLKNDLKKWQIEIFESQKLADENNHLFSKNSLNSCYTYMNTSDAIYSNYIIALFYIKKLEIELKKLRTKKSK